MLNNCTCSLEEPIWTMKKCVESQQLNHIPRPGAKVNKKKALNGTLSSDAGHSMRRWSKNLTVGGPYAAKNLSFQLILHRYKKAVTVAPQTGEFTTGRLEMNHSTGDWERHQVTLF